MFKIKNPLMTAAVSMALGLGMATGAQAGPATFNTHDADGVISINGLDWTQTSFLGQGAVAALGAFVGSSGSCPGGICNFNVITQATLGAFQLNGVNVSTPGLGTRYEVTMISKFVETVTFFNGTNLAQFATVTTGPTLIEFYYDRLPAGGGTGNQAVPLTGFGFNDGTLILKATSVTDAQGVFLLTSTAAQNLDQAPTAANNDYAGQLTLPGTGSNTAITVDSITQDFTFFQNPLTALGLNFDNISQSLPFKTVDPSDCFTNVALNLAVGTSNAAYACNNVHINGTYAAQGAVSDPAHGYLPVTGAVNGFGGGGGTDFVAQTDFNTGLDAVVPEPASLALMGLGLGVLGFGARRRRNPKAA